MRLALLFIVGCGSAQVVPEPILPPNVEQACDRAISCGVFLLEQKPECLACVEKLADLFHETYPDTDLPPLASVPCETIADYAHRTLVSECVVRRSFGP